MNGVFLPPDKGKSSTVIDGQTMATHNGSHAKEYYDYLLDLVEPIQNDEDNVIGVIEFVRKELLEGRLELGNIDQIKGGKK